jgi:hypothetical protein
MEKEASMDYAGILKRAWQVTWRHKALWLFGFLLALFGGGGDAGAGQGAQYSYGGGGRLPTRVDLAVIGFIAVGALLFALTGIVLRYVSEGALIGMVNEAEGTGETTVHNGWRIGWARFLRLLGIDLALGIPATIVGIIASALGLSPLMLLFARREGLTILAVVLTVGLMLGVIALLILLGTILSVVMAIAHRQSVLEGRGVMDSIRSSFALLRRNLRQVGVIWLILVLIGMVFAAIAVPVGVLLFGLAEAPAAALYAATESIAASLVVGLLLAIPGVVILSLLGGIYETFQSAVWTIAYRELQLR